MSDLILPPGVDMPPPIQPVETPPEDATAEEKATVLPEPSGYHILCGAVSYTHLTLPTIYSV